MCTMDISKENNNDQIVELEGHLQPRRAKKAMQRMRIQDADVNMDVDASGMCHITSSNAAVLTTHRYTTIGRQR